MKLTHLEIKMFNGTSKIFIFLGSPDYSKIKIELSGMHDEDSKFVAKWWSSERISISKSLKQWVDNPGTYFFRKFGKGAIILIPKVLLIPTPTKTKCSSCDGRGWIMSGHPISVVERCSSCSQFSGNIEAVLQFLNFHKGLYSLNEIRVEKVRKDPV